MFLCQNSSDFVQVDPFNANIYNGFNTTWVGKGSLWLTPRSFLFMILMATFSPVRMCRPSLTLAKPPDKHTMFITHIREDMTPTELFYPLTHIDIAITWADSLINLIVFEEFVVLRSFHRHPPRFSRTMINLTAGREKVWSSSVSAQLTKQTHLNWETHNSIWVQNIR